MEEQDLERGKHADTIIRNHVVWSMGAGFIPVLIADIFAVSALQLDMIRQLCKAYGVDFAEQQGKAIVTSLTGSTIARLTARSVVKLLPGIGSIIGGVAVSVFAGASTYALGEVFKKHFESGGTILDFDPTRVKKLYKEKFEKGKKVVEKWRSDTEKKEGQPEGGFKFREKTAESAPPAETSAPAANGKEQILAKLRELGDLKASGLLTEEEFDVMKKKLLEQF